MTREMTAPMANRPFPPVMTALNLRPNQIDSFLKACKKDGELKSALDLLESIGPMNATKLAAFLNSPHGKAELQELINIILIEFDALQHELEEKAMVSHIHKKRILAFLILVLLHAQHKAHARSELNEMIAEQIYKMLHPKHDDDEDLIKRNIFSHDFASILQSYGLVRAILETTIEDKVNESQRVHSELTIIQGLKQRYQIFTDHINHLNSYYDSIDSKESKLNSLRDKHSETMQRIEEIQGLIDGYLSEDRDDEAAKLLNFLNGLHLMSVGLEEMIAVEESKKSFLNEHGEVVNSTQQAHFILSKEKKLVKHEGAFYLLNKDQDLAKMSHEDKHQAKSHYDNARPEICCLKQVINEQASLNSQNEDLLMSKSNRLQKDIQTLDNQVKLIEAAEASTKALMMRPDANPAVVPTPKPVESGKAKSKTLPMTSKYLLTLIAQNPSPEHVERLIKTAQLTDRRLDPQQIRDFAKKIQPGLPIQETTMRDLLANSERLNVSAYKGNVTTAPSPLKMQLKPGSN